MRSRELVHYMVGTESGTPSRRHYTSISKYRINGEHFCTVMLYSQVCGGETPYTIGFHLLGRIYMYIHICL